MSMIRPWSFGIFTGDQEYAPWTNKDIPLFYIYSEHDQSLPPAVQEAMIATAGEIEVFRCDSDHSPMLDRPEWVAKVIRRAAGEQGIDL